MAVRRTFGACVSASTAGGFLWLPEGEVSIPQIWMPGRMPGSADVLPSPPPSDGDLVNFDGDALILGWFTTLKDEMQLMLLKAAHFCPAARWPERLGDTFPFPSYFGCTTSPYVFAIPACGEGGRHTLLDGIHPASVKMVDVWHPAVNFTWPGLRLPVSVH